MHPQVYINRFKIYSLIGIIAYTLLIVWIVRSCS
jgi:hypothetical protein